MITITVSCDGPSGIPRNQECRETIRVEGRTFAQLSLVALYKKTVAKHWHMQISPPNAKVCWRCPKCWRIVEARKKEKERQEKIKAKRREVRGG